MGEGIGAGAAGGAVEGFGRGLIEKENPFKTAAMGSLLGATGGGLFGLGAGKLGQNIAFRNLFKNPNELKFQNYVDNYLEGLSNAGGLRDYRSALQQYKLGEMDYGNIRGGVGRLNDIKNPRHRAQADLINKTNPAQDTYHTWIRNADDIFDFEDTLKPPQFDPDFIGNDFDPSYSWDMAQNAIRNGEIDVYSSYPIKEGVFVTPSQMEAGSYSGNGEIYSKRVPLIDVAWIDEHQGQYAPVDIDEFNYEKVIKLSEDLQKGEYNPLRYKGKSVTIKGVTTKEQEFIFHKIDSDISEAEKIKGVAVRRLPNPENEKDYLYRVKYDQSGNGKHKITRKYEVTDEKYD